MGFDYLVSGECSDIGLHRETNEDAIFNLPSRGVFCVADGMGGVEGGEFASQAAVSALREAFSAAGDPGDVSSNRSATLRAINSANLAIKKHAEENGLGGCGTTVVALVFEHDSPGKAVAYHAGDSRLYCFRSGRLRQITRDHSLAAAAGLKDDASVPAGFRGLITRAVGLSYQVNLEETFLDVRSGDLFLLCSDGLNRMLTDRRIARCIGRNARKPADALARLLVEEANRAGGHDNVSALLVRVLDLPRGNAAPGAPGTFLFHFLEFWRRIGARMKRRRLFNVLLFALILAELFWLARALDVF